MLLAPTCMVLPFYNKKKPNLHFGRVHRMNLICSNPLLNDTKQCIAFWKEVSIFNKKLDHLATEIERANEQLQISEDVTQKSIMFVKSNTPTATDENYSSDHDKMYDL